MTQGIRINNRFAPSKKAVKEAVALLYNTNALLGDGAPHVSLVATSIFGNEYDGPVEDAPDGMYFFVGPNENTDRRFYGQVIVRNGNVTIK